MVQGLCRRYDTCGKLHSRYGYVRLGKPGPEGGRGNVGEDGRSGGELGGGGKLEEQPARFGVDGCDGAGEFGSGMSERERLTCEILRDSRHRAREG